MADTLFLIDAHSLIFQVFHGIPEMSAPDGRPTNAVFGFSRDLLNLIELKKPNYLICAFDTSGPTFRDELYTEYKANRPPMPENLRPQIELIQQVIGAMGIPVLECRGFEADDVVATVVRQANDRNIHTFICTSDKDVRQLIGPQVVVYNIRKDEIFDADVLQREWGIRPDQVVDLLAMTGDSVDNVPGIDGVGPKTAAALLQQFGTLENVLANLERVSGAKRQENLRAGAEQGRRARELVLLRSDVPIQVDWEAARVKKFDAPRLTDLFRQFGFRRLTEQFGNQSPPPAEWKASYETVQSIAQLENLVDELSRQPRFAFDLITTESHPMRSRLVGISLAWKPNEAWYVAVRAPIGDRCLPESNVLTTLRTVLESDRVIKLGHNLKHHAITLRRAGICLSLLGLDTMVADYLLEAGERSHNLDQIGSRYLQHTTKRLADLRGTGQQQFTLDRVPVSEIAQYAGEIALVVLRASEVLEPRLKAHGLWNLYETLENPLIEVLADMEFEGVLVDVQLLARLSREFADRLQEIEREIYSLAGGEFNIASPIQLRDVLFEKLELPVLKRTKTGPSTDQEVLEELAQQHPLPALLIEHRQVAKLKNTYVDAIPELVNPDTGRVHATLNQVVAATGRLSSSDPNLQNIPIRTEQGRQIRQAFVARKPTMIQASAGDNHPESTAGQGWRLLTADYSQIELRILAHLSGDPELCRAFSEDQDIHTFVASQIYGVQPSETSSEMRRGAKTVNFGVIYGLSPFGLAARLGISKEDAEAFIDSYFVKYRGVEAFIRQVLERASRDGYVTTILGRRRKIAGVRPKPGRWLNQPEREAVNTVVQGSAADLIKVAMVNLHRRIHREELRSRTILQIHDELLIEVPDDELHRMAVTVTEEMTGAIKLNVPLKVEVAAGPNWLDVETVEMPAIPVPNGH